MSRRDIQSALRIALIASVFVLPGCAVGPNFQRPPAPVVNAYASESLSASTTAVDIAHGDTQRLVEGMDIPAQWWSLLHSQPLNDLIEQAFKASPNVVAAQAALRNANENVQAQRGSYFPSVSAQIDPSRQKIAGSLASPAASASYMYSLTTAQVSVSFAPDVFGGNRRQVESLAAQAESQRFTLEATYLTLSTNLANAAIQDAALRAQIAATQDIIDDQTKTLTSFRQQFASGQLAEADVAGQEAALAQTQASLPPLQKQLAQQRDLILALAGRYPDDQAAPAFELSNLQLPDALPLSLPSQLVEQRPDIRAAEAQMHAASAQIGVAIANRLPNFSIDAGFGNASDHFSKLFTTSNTFWNLAGNITTPLFDGSTLLHRQRASEAAYDEAAAQYRSTVIAAFQNVADTLHAIQSDADALKAALRAERAAARSLAIAHQQLALGDIGYLAMLGVDQTWQQARINLILAQANRLADSVTLFQALGGGWWNRIDAIGNGSITTNPASKAPGNGFRN